MGALKRNIILSNKTVKTNEMAILTIEKLSEGIAGTLKIFNINNNNLLLAISCNNNEAFKGPVNLSNNSFKFKLKPDFDINGKISCVVVEHSNNKITPLVWDSVKNNKDVQEKAKTYFGNNHSTSQNNPTRPDLSEMFDIKKEQFFDEGEIYKSNHHNTNINKNKLIANQNNFSKTKNSLSDIQMEKLFEHDSDEELGKLIDETIKENETTRPNSVFGDETEKLKKKLDENSVFYDLVSEQIEDIFSKYPSEENLEKLIPNSKWVLVDYEDEGNLYVLGLIYEETTLKYICYGVPGEFSQNPPRDIEQYSQWLPKDPNNIAIGGYWVMYQDSVSGENLLIEYI